uniref:RRM domain-containing protein n=1 Tax=Mesocestoides corti TaxID=53468 RepID=A0A5K3ESF5_MESCO
MSLNKNQNSNPDFPQSREGLFGNLCEPTTPKSLFPTTKFSTQSCGLFGLSVISSEAKCNSGPASNEPHFEIEQRDALTTPRFASEESSASIFSPPTGLFKSTNDTVSQPTLFSGLKTRMSDQADSFSIRPFQHSTTAKEISPVEPVSVNLSLTPNQMGLFQRSENSSQQASPGSEQKPSLAPRQAKQQTPQREVLTAVKLSRISPNMNQKAHLSKLFSRFGKIERIICQPSVGVALVAFSSHVDAQRAKSEAAELIPGVVASFGKCVRRTSGLTSSISPKSSSSLPNFFRIPSKESPNLPSMGPASTVLERLAVLEARDRAEHDRRQTVSGRPRLTSRSSSRQSAISGTCRDMCPETERYFRELRQRVSVFECLNSEISSSLWQMDHKKAVKDYSRSAADQAEPLPRELRPPEVLQRTMNYLLAAIADRPELDQSGNLWKPWYEFLWTRTRAIRKDITQQRLCSSTVVSIVEKITRFHIFCAARLVDQSMDAFDPRINSENLTQCLQTLKELYGDLRKGGAVMDQCLCEPEFRAYMILMKLNDCSVLDEVQKFPEALRKSPEVQFAIAIHSAVTERNYVRFFRLVRTSDCLTACLLHRYFSQVRSHALFALSAAFSRHPKHEVGFPLSTFVHQLAFESRTDAKAFCEHWNLLVSDDDLIFQRQSPPREPEFAWHERRAPKLIEDKRAGQTLADLFNGGPTDSSYATPDPVHSSFDSHGRLMPEEEEVQNGLCCSNYTSTTTGFTATPPVDPKPSMPLFEKKAAAGTQPADNPRKPSFQIGSGPNTPSEQVFSEEASLEALGELINEMVDTETRSIASLAVCEEEVTEDVADALLEEIVNSSVTEIIREAAESHSNCLSSIIEEAADLVIADFVCSSISAIISDTLDEKVALSVYEDILAEVLESLVFRVFQKAHIERFNRLRLLARTFTAWNELRLSEERREIRVRNLILSIPATPAPQLLIGYAHDEQSSGCRRNWLESIGADNCGDSDRVNHPLKRSRFSHDNDEIDLRLAWQPLGPICSFPDNVCLGVILSPTAPHFSSWLLSKLPTNITFTTLSFMDQLTGHEAGLIVVVSNNDIITPLPIPQLHLYPRGIRDPGETLSSIKSISFPPLSDNNRNAVMAYRWSVLLQDGIEWLAEKVRDDKAEAATKVENAPLTAASSSWFSSRPKSLMDIVVAQVETNFLKPLLSWIEQWKEMGITDPDPHYILDAYNRSLDPLRDLVPNSVFISPVPEPLPPCASWTEGLKHWLSFLDSQIPQTLVRCCKLSLQGCETWRRVSALLIPWGSLCAYLIRSKLDLLTDECLESTPASTVELTAVDVFSDLGPQFSVATITRNFDSRPITVSVAGRRLPQKPRSSSALLQQIQELDAKISDVSSKAQSISRH